MGIANMGIPGFILILVLALLIFEPKKLPEIGRAAGQTLQEFKKAASELISDPNAEVRKDKTSQD